MDVSQMSTQEIIDAMAPEPTEDDVREAAVAEGSEADVSQLADTEQAVPVVPSADAVVAPADAETVKDPAAEVVEPAAVEATPAPSAHDRAIVKAARASETRALKELAKAKRELEELRALVPAKAEAKPDPKVLEDVKQYAPEASQYIEVLEKQVEELKKATPQKQEEAEPEFIPEPLDKDPDVAAEVQADLDQVPELASWHVNPDQRDWQRAKTIDEFLFHSPKWQGKSNAERWKEVVRLRKEEVAETSGRARDVAGTDPVVPSPTPPKQATKPTAEDAKRVIEAKAKSAPVTTSDFRGRSPPTRIASKRDAWHSMTNEQLLAQLPEIPE